MKVHIGGLELSDVTFEDLDQLVQRYGNGVENHAAPAKRGNGSSNGNGNGHGSVTADRVVLERLLSAGESGILTTELGDLLSRKGKAVKPGLNLWARRIKLVTEDGIDPFEPARPEGRRGWKLRGTLLPVAEALLEEMR